MRWIWTFLFNKIYDFFMIQLIFYAAWYLHIYEKLGFEEYLELPKFDNSM